ncbi:acyltransferase [Streptomyces sp. MW-W600-10]|uniref:acyltransferase family protein n=1 Tax=Streptomyces sp. MW-W600-10 TaxID=2829819 RepID=UPI001C478812|nr:acyltransferase [Streptomyces sp. MW-W600-10]MBV7244319.1 acyltransferase [Streptomyces sp. MW-W600-10]
MTGLVARVEAATPPGRDRAVDALRALAILGVVGGHWLVTALVADSGTVRGASPLAQLPELTPVSWVFQTLAVFFLVGGQVAAGSWASARKRGVPYGRWVGGRLARLFRPVAAVLVVWALAAAVMLVAGVGEPTVRALAKLVWSPLWFLLVFAALTALTPLVARLHPLWPLVVVLHVDLVRLGLGGPRELGWINVVAGWLVPYCLGALVARGGLRGRAGRWALLLGGTVAAAALVRWAGYPASMVGVPGGRMSNLDPPSLAAAAFGLAQCGAALLLLGPLRRVLRRPAVWAVVAVVNLSAMTVFLWHQTAMIIVTASALLLADEPLPGLHTVPDDVGWVVARLFWLPVFALALLGYWAVFRGCEQGGRRGGGGSLVVRESAPERRGRARRA